MSQTLHLINSDVGDRALAQGTNLGLSPLTNGLRFFLRNVDLTGWQPVAEIRTNLLSNGGQLLGAFIFDPPSYGPKLDAQGQPVLEGTTPIVGTTLKGYLPAYFGNDRQTLAVPPKEFPQPVLLAEIDHLIATRKIVIGQHAWVWDVQIKNPADTGVLALIKPSLVQVIAEVSR